jgi:hypothetical protein
VAIVLPIGLTTPEIRVLQEFRRVGSDTMTTAAIVAIKHPAGGGEEPAKSLAAKGFLVADGGGYALTATAKELLALDPKPEFESAAAGDAAEA